MTEPVVSITIALPLAHAWAFAQFLKRTEHSDCLHWTKDSDEAYQMLTAGEKIRIALPEAGVTLR